MNRVAKFAVVSAFSSLALAGVSRAASLGMDTPEGISQTLRTFHSTNFDVQQVYDHGDRNDLGGPLPFEGVSPQDVHMIQASIEANKPLTRQLGQEGVAVRNIVNADQAADGSVTFYVQ
jgi:hypothetical protein